MRKGYGLITASLIALSFFYFGPILAAKLWPLAVEMIERN